MSRQTNRTMDRQDHARMLRLSGMTWQEVADSPDPTGPVGTADPLYGSADAARDAARIAAARHGGTASDTSPPVTMEERRQLLWDRYELLIFAWQEKALGGDDVAAGIVRQSLVAQSRLYGLNMRPPAVPTERTGEEVDPVDDIGRKRAERQARRTETAG